SGGMRYPSNRRMRYHSIELEWRVGSTRSGEERPRLPSCGATPTTFIDATETVERRSIDVPVGPPGRWHIEQFASRYARARSATSADASASEGCDGREAGEGIDVENIPMWSHVRNWSSEVPPTTR